MFYLTKKEALICCLVGSFIQCENDINNCIYFDNYFFDKDDNGIDIDNIYTHEDGEDDSPTKWRTVSCEEAEKLILSFNCR